MKRAYEMDGDQETALVEAKRPGYSVIECDLCSVMESPLSYGDLDLNEFESNSRWSDGYLAQLNLSRRPFDFQIELVQSVIKSGNSIVCIRTGAGKTYVAALLIKYYFMKKMKEQQQQRFLCVFFVPHRAIRDQQVAAIRSAGDMRVIGCDDDSYVHEFVRHYEVIVCTPQKFLNCLQEKKLQLDQIDLMIFDECHNCIGNHPYSKIMEQCMIVKASDKSPRIIGLTASCGTKLTHSEMIRGQFEHSMNKYGKALMKLFELCAILNCYAISIVTRVENIQELNTKIHRPTQDKMLLIRSTPFDEQIQRLMDKFSSLLLYIAERGIPQLSVSVEEQALVEAKINAEREKNFRNVVLLKYMIMLVKRWIALYDLPLESILVDTNNRLDLFYRKKETPLEVETLVYTHGKKVLEGFVEEWKSSDYYTTNPKLDFLTDTIKELIETRQNARGLVLVPRTLYAKTLFDYFKKRVDVQDIIKPCWLVGQSSKDFSMTLSEQDNMLKDFRQGLANVLIATDIVQEGLDVPECSFVIRYEFVSNEIGTVQSRGRARAEQSACFLITTQGSQLYFFGKVPKVHLREEKNREREREMQEAIDTWQTMSTEELHHNIRQLQDAIFHLRAQEVYIPGNPPAELEGKLMCRSCNYYLGKLSAMRRRNTCYFVRQQDIKDHIEVEPFEKELSIKELRLLGNIRCGNKRCREKLGGGQLYSDRPDVEEMCAFKCNSLKFSFVDESNTERVETFKKWSDVPYPITELEPFIPRDVRLNSSIAISTEP